MLLQTVNFLTCSGVMREICPRSQTEYWRLETNMARQRWACGGGVVDGPATNARLTKADVPEYSDGGCQCRSSIRNGMELNIRVRVRVATQEIQE